MTRSPLGPAGARPVGPPVGPSEARPACGRRFGRNVPRSGRSASCCATGGRSAASFARLPCRCRGVPGAASPLPAYFVHRPLAPRPPGLLRRPCRRPGFSPASMPVVSQTRRAWFPVPAGRRHPALASGGGPGGPQGGHPARPQRDRTRTVTPSSPCTGCGPPAPGPHPNQAVRLLLTAGPAAC